MCSFNYDVLIYEYIYFLVDISEVHAFIGITLL